MNRPIESSSRGIKMMEEVPQVEDDLDVAYIQEGLKSLSDYSEMSFSRKLARWEAMAKKRNIVPIQQKALGKIQEDDIFEKDKSFFDYIPIDGENIDPNIMKNVKKTALQVIPEEAMVDLSVLPDFSLCLTSEVQSHSIEEPPLQISDHDQSIGPFPNTSYSTKGNLSIVSNIGMTNMSNIYSPEEDQFAWNGHHSALHDDVSLNTGFVHITPSTPSNTHLVCSRILQTTELRSHPAHNNQQSEETTTPVTSFPVDDAIEKTFTRLTNQVMEYDSPVFCREKNNHHTTTTPTNNSVISHTRNISISRIPTPIHIELSPVLIEEDQARELHTPMLVHEPCFLIPLMLATTDSNEQLPESPRTTPRTIRSYSSFHSLPANEIQERKSSVYEENEATSTYYAADSGKYSCSMGLPTSSRVSSYAPSTTNSVDSFYHYSPSPFLPMLSMNHPHPQQGRRYYDYTNNASPHGLPHGLPPNYAFPSCVTPQVLSQHPRAMDYSPTNMGPTHWTPRMTEEEAEAEEKNIRWNETFQWLPNHNEEYSPTRSLIYDYNPQINYSPIQTPSFRTPRQAQPLLLQENGIPPVSSEKLLPRSTTTATKKSSTTAASTSGFRVMKDGKDRHYFLPLDGKEFHEELLTSMKRYYSDDEQQGRRKRIINCFPEDILNTLGNTMQKYTTSIFPILKSNPTSCRPMHHSQHIYDVSAIEAGMEQPTSIINAHYISKLSEYFLLEKQRLGQFRQLQKELTTKTAHAFNHPNSSRPHQKTPQGKDCFSNTLPPQMNDLHEDNEAARDASVTSTKEKRRKKLNKVVSSQKSSSQKRTKLRITTCPVAAADFLKRHDSGKLIIPNSMSQEHHIAPLLSTPLQTPLGTPTRHSFHSMLDEEEEEEVEEYSMHSRSANVAPNRRLTHHPVQNYDALIQRHNQQVYDLQFVLLQEYLYHAIQETLQTHFHEKLQGIAPIAFNFRSYEALSIHWDEVKASIESVPVQPPVLCNPEILPPIEHCMAIVLLLPHMHILDIKCAEMETPERVNPLQMMRNWMSKKDPTNKTTATAKQNILPKKLKKVIKLSITAYRQCQEKDESIDYTNNHYEGEYILDGYDDKTYPEGASSRRSVGAEYEEDSEVPNNEDERRITPHIFHQYNKYTGLLVIYVTHMQLPTAAQTQTVHGSQQQNLNHQRPLSTLSSFGQTNGAYTSIDWKENPSSKQTLIEQKPSQRSNTNTTTDQNRIRSTKQTRKAKDSAFSPLNKVSRDSI